MTALHSDLNADPGCGSNISTDAQTLVSARIEEIKDIRALCWCPGVVVIRVYFCPHIFYKQAQRTLSIWNVLKRNVCMLAEMSGMDAN
jgi:hypothetical protein